MRNKSIAWWVAIAANLVCLALIGIFVANHRHISSDETDVLWSFGILSTLNLYALLASGSMGLLALIIKRRTQEERAKLRDLETMSDS